MGEPWATWAGLLKWAGRVTLQVWLGQHPGTGEREFRLERTLGTGLWSMMFAWAWWGSIFTVVNERMKSILFEDRVLVCLRTWSGA